MEATKVHSIEDVLEQNAIHIAEFLEGGEDREAFDIAAANPHGEELALLVQADWMEARKKLPPWLRHLNTLCDDFEEHWLPAALDIVREGTASVDAVAVAADHAWVDGASHFREAFSCPEVSPTSEVDSASPRPAEPEVAKEPVEPIARTLPAIIPPAPPPLAPNYEDACEAMNDRHAVIDNVGGKAVIASWEPSQRDHSKQEVIFHNKDSFLLRYSNRSVQ